MLVGRDQNISNDLFISSGLTEKKQRTYVSSTVMGWNVVCLDVVVVYLDSSLVDTYSLASFRKIWEEERTIKKRDLGLVDGNVQGGVGKSSRNFNLLLERFVVSLGLPH